MGKYLSVIGGIVAVAAGAWGAYQWWDPEMIGFLKALLVFLLVCGGLLALVAGITEIKETAAQNSEKK